MSPIYAKKDANTLEAYKENRWTVCPPFLHKNQEFWVKFIEANAYMFTRFKNLSRSRKIFKPSMVPLLVLHRTTFRQTQARATVSLTYIFGNHDRTLQYHGLLQIGATNKNILRYVL